MKKIMIVFAIFAATIMLTLPCIAKPIQENTNMNTSKEQLQILTRLETLLKNQKPDQKPTGLLGLLAVILLIIETALLAIANLLEKIEGFFRKIRDIIENPEVYIFWGIVKAIAAVFATIGTAVIVFFTTIIAIISSILKI